MATSTKEKPKKAVAKKEDSDIDELAALAAASKAYEDEDRSKTGSSNSFISLAQGNTGIVKPDNKAFVKGAKLYDFVIPKLKLVLGQTIDATVLGIFSLYAESEKKARESDMAKTVSFWLPEDAEQIPLEQGSNFNHILPNGNLLQPVYWAFLYLHKHPEIDDALLAFRSIGNKVCRELKKEIAANSAICTELRFTIGKQSIASKNYSEPSYYPKFEISGRNFKYEDGKLIAVKGGLKKDELAEVLRRGRELQESYSTMRMVSKKNLSALLGPTPRKALAGPASDDDERVTF
jgi:hypothetical protein